MYLRAPHGANTRAHKHVSDGKSCGMGGKRRQRTQAGTRSRRPLGRAGTRSAWGRRRAPRRCWKSACGMGIGVKKHVAAPPTRGAMCGCGTHHQSGSASRRSPVGHTAPMGQGRQVPPDRRLKSPPLQGSQKRWSNDACVPGGQGAMVMLPVNSRPKQTSGAGACDASSIEVVRTVEHRQRGRRWVCGGAKHAHLVRQPDLALRHERAERGHTCNEPSVPTEHRWCQNTGWVACTRLMQQQQHRWSQLHQCAPG
jgi:hypothetical protein